MNFEYDASIQGGVVEVHVRLRRPGRGLGMVRDEVSVIGHLYFHRLADWDAFRDTLITAQEFHNIVIDVHD